MQAQVGEGGVAAVDGVDGEAGPAQSRGDELGQGLLVLGDQYAHALFLAGVHSAFYAGKRFADLSVSHRPLRGALIDVSGS
ncbi:hypothetical protein GCM10010272_10130 [Streptomyces lateritius]|nr:hypothetical protein GCM10010272_10130 [Streptomyces lateritius]